MLSHTDSRPEVCKCIAQVSKFYKGMGDILAPKLQQAAAKVTTRA